MHRLHSGADPQMPIGDRRLRHSAVFGGAQTICCSAAKLICCTPSDTQAFPPEFGLALLETVMSSHPTHKPHPVHDVPDDLVPGSMPVQPDNGPIPAPIPDDGEDDAVVDPEI